MDTATLFFVVMAGAGITHYLASRFLHTERFARTRYMRWVSRQDPAFQEWHRTHHPERHDPSFLA